MALTCPKCGPISHVEVGEICHPLLTAGEVVLIERCAECHEGAYSDAEVDAVVAMYEFDEVQFMAEELRKQIPQPKYWQGWAVAWLFFAAGMVIGAAIWEGM